MDGVTLFSSKPKAKKRKLAASAAAERDGPPANADEQRLAAAQADLEPESHGGAGEKHPSFCSLSHCVVEAVGCAHDRRLYQIRHPKLAAAAAAAAVAAPPADRSSGEARPQNPRSAIVSVQLLGPAPLRLHPMTCRRRCRRAGRPACLAGCRGGRQLPAAGPVRVA